MVAVDAVDGTTLVPLLLVHVDGLFEGALLALPAAGYRLQVRWADGNESLIDDPYRFGPVLGEMDAWLLGEGSHLRPFEILGAHARTMEGVAGTSFAVWAPNASSIVWPTRPNWPLPPQPCRSFRAGAASYGVTVGTSFAPIR